MRGLKTVTDVRDRTSGLIDDVKDWVELLLVSISVLICLFTLTCMVLAFSQMIAE